MTEAEFYDDLAIDASLSADRAKAVINAIQKRCVDEDIPTYRYSQDMQVLTETVLSMDRLATEYQNKAKQLRS